jgi:hypothetical protein
MSTRYSIASRTPLLNSLFAGIACAATLALTAGPALAAPGDFDRVEINGRVVEAPTRYDIRASCQGVETQLQNDLAKTWLRERSYGTVNVKFVIDSGEITAVRARGVSMPVARAVRNAVGKMQCTNAGSGTFIYNMQVVFVDPEAWRDDTSVADAGATSSPYRIALVEKP